MSAPVSYILGVDPGLSGALAFLTPAQPAVVTVEDMPVANGTVAGAVLAERVRQMAPDLAVIERVSAMPGQGVSSTFTFGRSYGAVIGVLAALNVPLHFVAPTVWKKHFHLPADKEAARARALELWPSAAEAFSRKKDAGRAEAALIARYGLDVLPGLKTEVAA